MQIIEREPPQSQLMAHMASAVFATTVAAMFVGVGASHAQVRLKDGSAGQSGQVKEVQSTPTPFTTIAEQCIVPAANFHGVNPWLLRAVLRVESSLKPHAIGRNKNGTLDIGIGQINSMHLPELRKYGIEPGHLTDACVGTYVAGWFLKKSIAERGYTWEGVASYHSRTPEFNIRYQRLLIAEIHKSQKIAPSSTLIPTPIGQTSVVRREVQSPYLIVAPKGAQQPIGDQGMVVFEQKEN